MSGLVKYPYHVRHNGVDYNPGEPFEVGSVEAHVQRGAIEVAQAEKPQKQRKRGNSNAPKGSGE